MQFMTAMEGNSRLMPLKLSILNNGIVGYSKTVVGFEGDLMAIYYSADTRKFKMSPVSWGTHPVTS